PPPGGALAPAPPPPPSPFTAPQPVAPGTPDGFFIDTEIAVLFPSYDTHGTPTLHVPTTSLGVSVSPTFDIAYKLPGDQGYFALTYRFLSADGNGTVNQDGIDLATKTRLSVNTFGVDYGSAPWEFSPRWTFSWRVGGRIEQVFVESEGTSAAGLT